MYINLHTKSHIFLKIGIFYKKIITFSESAYLMKKSTFLSKFHFCLHKINIFAPKLILTETLVILPQSLHHIILSLDLEIHSFAQKTDAFCIKCYFLLKQKNATKNWHFSKTENTPLRISPLKTKLFENCDYWLQKWKNLQNWCFCKIFAFTSEAHITKKLTLLILIVIFFKIYN